MSTAAIPPRIVIEGADQSVDAAVRAAVADGWIVHDGFDPPYGPPVTVRQGIVDSAESAAAAMLAALAGCGLIVGATASRQVTDHLVDDLRHVGPVDHRVLTSVPSPRLDDDGRAILALLAEGLSLREAGATLGLSRRTADRRLAAARTALGVTRTTEAVAVARRLGWLRDVTGFVPER